jgi:hypothetical protein
MTMLKQIKRVFLKHKEQCGVIGQLDPVLRQNALRWTERVCKMHVGRRMAGLRVWRGIPRNVRVPRS